MPEGGPTKDFATIPNAGPIPKIHSVFDFTAEALEQLAFWFEQRGLKIPLNNLMGLRFFTGSKTWDPANTADGAMTSTTVTLVGATLGDFTLASFSVAVPAGAILASQVTAADTVTVTLFNKTGGALDLASGTLKVGLFR